MRVDSRKLTDASEALKRASAAAWRAEQWPNSGAFPCGAQIKAALEEIACAEELIRQSMQP